MAGERKRQLGDDWEDGPDDWEDEAPADTGPRVGAGETFLNRAVNALPGGRVVTDALSTAAMQGAKALGVGDSGVKFTPQAQAELRARGMDTGPESTIPGVVDTYRDMRDTRAERTEAGAEQNPWTARFGTAAGIGLSLLAPLPKASGTGLGANVRTGAGYGAFEGLTNGSADLTRGEFGQAAKDTLTGAALGAGAGALGHGVVQAGRKGVQALRGARADVLQQEAAALREAADQGQQALAKDVSKHRELVGRARGMMGKDLARREQVQGQAIEMDKALGRKAARSEERAQKLLERSKKREAPPPDPSTKVLDGYHGKAHQAQQHRSDKALEYQRGMGEPDLPTNVASSRQDYIDRMPAALEDPPALRRQFMEKFLRRKYGDEVAERILRERIGPGGEVLPRPSAPGTPAAPQVADDVAGGPSLAEEAEAAMAARRGEAPALPSGRDELPLMPALEVESTRSGLPSGLTPPVARRDNSPYFDVADRPPPGFDRAPTRAGGGAAPRAEPAPAPAPENSMATPQDLPLALAPTRATAVPEVRRPLPAPRQAEPTVNVRERTAIPAGPPAPAPAPAAPATDEIQDVTRLATPDDVGPLAMERATARERGALGEMGRAGMEGVRNSGNVLGAVVAGAANITRAALNDPAVKARALSMARLHLLAQANPDLFNRVGATLAAAAAKGESSYRAQKYLEIRSHPELRVAEQKAAEQADQLSDEELYQLIASGQP